MRTNGFIFIALGFAAAAMAGMPGYLPAVGPVTLRFDNGTPPPPPLAELPGPSAINESPDGAVSQMDVTTAIPVATSANPAPAALMQNPPVVLPDDPASATAPPVAPLIGPLMETNGVVTPQMLLRFFTPPQGGSAREAVVIIPPGFNPARPPTPSSTVIYTQPKP